MRINPDDDEFNIMVKIGHTFEHIKDVKDKEICDLKDLLSSLKIVGV